MPKKNKIHTDEKLLLIQHIYGEQVNENELGEILLVPENRKEYEILKNVKEKLESSSLRKHTSVSEEVIKQIFLAARPQSPRYWSGMTRRPRRLVLLTGMGAVTACVLFILFSNRPQSETPRPEINQISDTIELQWDDTQDRIEMQQALSIVRQRINPDLWDESEVMKLDSLPDVLTNTRRGFETASNTPQ
ncbi:MAG: hypothetical protein OXE92_06590 [Bacteroidetes bacterium]|nr:hypothetical protein [Bacteroidota bacterium]MCY4205375.1 hypothetical protein [Bacteroidota bacterium]